ncbi:MAG: bifunctional hydroxymethylpyrimidine kinase/phosphomethylpyrimidine kinase [Luteibaculum sp.]
MPNVLSIAGLDPTTGAGIGADQRAIEHFGNRAFTVCTAITAQSDFRCYNVDFLPQQLLLTQLEPLLNEYELGAIKIGIIGSLVDLNAVLSFVLKFQNPMVIWDPVLKSSSGLSFLQALDPQELQDVLQKIDLCTPNREESSLLLSKLQKETWKDITISASILETGGDKPESNADVLYKDGSSVEFPFERIPNKSIHGTGCRYSSAIASLMAGNSTLEQAIVKAQEYVRAEILKYHKLESHA